MVALWYRYQNGSFECATPTNAAVVEFLRNDSKVAFDISTNHRPYRGVRGNCTSAMSPDKDKGTLQVLIEKYRGEIDSPLAEWLLNDDSVVIRIRIQPKECTVGTIQTRWVVIEVLWPEIHTQHVASLRCLPGLRHQPPAEWNALIHHALRLTDAPT